VLLANPGGGRRVRARFWGGEKNCGGSFSSKGEKKRGRGGGTAFFSFFLPVCVAEEGGKRGEKRGGKRGGP